MEMSLFKNYSVKEEIAEASTSFTKQEGVQQGSGDEPLDITQQLQGQVTDMECCEINSEDFPNAGATADHVSTVHSEACVPGLIEELPEEQSGINYYDGQVTDMECCEIRPEDIPNSEAVVDLVSMVGSEACVTEIPNSEAVVDLVSMVGSEACVTELLETLPEEQYYVNYYDAISTVKLEFRDSENIEREDHSWLERSSDTDSSSYDHVNISIKKEKGLNLKRKLIVYEDEEEFIAKFGDPGANNASNAVQLGGLSYTSTPASSQSGAPPAKRTKTTHILKKQNKEDIRAREASTACLLIEKKYKKVIVYEGMNQNAKKTSIRTSTLHKNKQRAKWIITSTNASKPTITTRSYKKKLICGICNYKCDSTRGLRYHIKTHADEKLHCFGTCASPANKIKIKHISNKQNKENTRAREAAAASPLTRNKSKEVVVENDKVKTSKRRIRTPNHNQYICDICNYKCNNKTALRFHIETHDEEPSSFGSCASPAKKIKTKHSSNKQNKEIIKAREASAAFPLTRNKLKEVIARNGEVKTSKRRIRTPNHNQYICDICNYKCDNKTFLRFHIETHDEEPYSFGSCASPSSADKIKIKHISNKHNKENKRAREAAAASPLTRNKIKEMFEKDKFNRNAKKHSTLHTNSRRAISTKTGKRRTRTRSDHNQLICDICNHKYNSKSALKYHIKTHADKKPFICETCKYSCNLKSSLEQHIRTHTGEKPFACNICDYKCSSKSGLRYHIGTHARTRADVNPFTCDICSYKCCDKTSLKQHIRRHTEEKPFICNICDYKCRTKSDFTYHSSSHDAGKLYICDNCSYKCNEKSKLILHMRKHADEKPFACDFCAYKCRDRSTLTKHRRTHTGDKPYACSKCAYRSTIMHGLKVHYRIHTGAKPFTCKTCNFKFRDESGLRKHARIHTGEKPYGCNLCAYKSSLKQSLMLHIRLHTGEKPYACSICNKTYVSVGRLNNHKRACFWKLGPTRG